jgi:hypothetical protein
VKIKTEQSMEEQKEEKEIKKKSLLEKAHFKRRQGRQGINFSIILQGNSLVPFSKRKFPVN